jgi:predicted MFS family arabinose efflux permease
MMRRSLWVPSRARNVTSIPSPRAPPRAAFPLYLTSSSLWIAAMSLQGFLVTWMLVGVLERPADHVGFARALIDLPGLAILLLGGLLADRVDGRSLLLHLHVLIALPCFALAALAPTPLFGFWSVVVWGMAVSMLQSVSDPARQAMLSRVSQSAVQRTITIMTIVTSFVGLAAVWLGGQLERIGLVPVLVIQGLVFAAGALAIRPLPPMPVLPRPPGTGLLDGIHASWRAPLIRDTIAQNFLSSLFNAGAYIVAVPFIVKEVYDGDADFFALVVMIFTAGSIGSNFVLLRFMPLLRPGRLFLLMQLTRVVVLAILWTEPELWLFHLAILAWGANMGVTSTLVRTTVQELAPEAHRAQILSVLLLSFLVSAPVSSLLLGPFIARFDPLAALLPGVAISLLIFAWGTGWSGVWHYEAADGRDARAR